MINRDDLLSGTRPEITNKVLVTVMEHFEGYEVVEYKGMVWGISMRAKDMGQDFLMGCKQVTGGELSSYTELSDESRQKAVDRMIGMAKRIGANAIINFKFEQAFVAVSSSAEVTAFGNAVVIRPIKNYVPTGGLGNMLAEFVDCYAISHKIERPNLSSENKAALPAENFAITKDMNGMPMLACPTCNTLYATEMVSGELRVKNFKDNDPLKKGQQIICINCGEEFTVPYGINLKNETNNS